ncbi:MAG: hypothetical protein ACOC7K_01905 [bacterium]
MSTVRRWWYLRLVHSPKKKWKTRKNAILQLARLGDVRDAQTLCAFIASDRSQVFTDLANSIADSLRPEVARQGLRLCSDKPLLRNICRTEMRSPNFTTHHLEDFSIHRLCECTDQQIDEILRDSLKRLDRDDGRWIVRWCTVTPALARSCERLVDSDIWWAALGMLGEVKELHGASSVLARSRAAVERNEFVKLADPTAAWVRSATAKIIARFGGGSDLMTLYKCIQNDRQLLGQLRNVIISRPWEPQTELDKSALAMLLSELGLTLANYRQHFAREEAARQEKDRVKREELIKAENERLRRKGYPLCDLCGDPMPFAESRMKVSGDQMVRAVRVNGFNPFKLGLVQDMQVPGMPTSPQAKFQWWVETLVHPGGAGWTICMKCYVELTKYAH